MVLARFFVGLIVIGLSGCGIFGADPPVAEDNTEAVITAIPTVESTEVLDYIAADDFVCVPAGDEVMAWLGDFGTVDSDWTSGELTTVLVGPGNDPNEQWWIVALTGHDPDGRSENPVFLTNAPSPNQPSGETWIRVDRAGASVTSSVGWQQVRWPTERIEKGQRAEAFAINCLSEAAQQ